MKILLSVLIVSLLFFDSSLAQVGIGTTTPNTHAVLELVSPNNNQGLMPPRLTTSQRTASGFTSALTASDKGLLVYDSDDNKFYYWKGSAWEPVQNGVASGGGSGTVTSIATGTGLSGGPVTTSGTIALANTSVTSGTYGSATQVGQFAVDQQGRITNATNVTITGAAPTGLAGGDLTGNFPNPVVAKLQGAPVSATTPATNQVLKYNGTSWSPAADANSGGTVTNVTGGTGLSGTITTTGTISLANTAVAPNTYGDATHVSQIVVDAQGRITNAGNVLITGAAPTGAAGGDLTGNFPNPTIAAGKVTSAAILDGTVTTADIAATSVTDAKIASGITTSKLSPSATNGQVLTTVAGATAWANAPGGAPTGPAGGDLTGTYPNPAIGAGKVTSAAILDGTVATADLAATSVTDVKIATGITASKVSPSATNGQVLTTVAGATAWANAPGGAPTGPAGGDLTGTYPNPTIGAGKVTSATVLDGTLVNTDISAGAAITDNKLSTITTAGKVLGDAITSGTISGTTAMNTSGNIVTSSQVNAGSASYTGVAVNATSSSNNAIVATSNTGHGVDAQASGGSSRAVWGFSPNGIAIEGQLAAGTGVIAYATTGTGLSSSSTSGNGVYAVTGNTNGGYGVYGEASGVQTGEFSYTFGNAVFGINKFFGTYGVLGAQYGVYGNGAGQYAGVYGDGGGTYGVGVIGNSQYSDGGQFFSYGGYGIYATSQTKDAGHFVGSVSVSNGFSVTGGTKNFKIDHPLDSANKYLYHASIESSEVLNIYSGTIILGKNGKGVVTMPTWFETLNKDYRYQLTCIGGFAKVYVDEELINNQFTIAGGKKGMKVSWQITGIRNDAYMQKHPFKVEVEKAGEEKGTYLNPGEHGVSETLGIDYEITRRMNARR